MSPGQRQALADELLARHSEALAPSASADAPSPEEIVRRLREEEHAAPDASARYAPNTVIDESHLDTMPADMLDGPASALAPGWIDGAQPGLWCHLFIEGGWHAARLVWVSQARRHWLFAGDAGRAHLLTLRAIERLAREGLLQPLEERSLLERAVDSWLADKAPART